MTYLTFYGGLNEIGGNKVLLEEQNTSIFIDFGISFSHVSKYYEEFLQPRTYNFLTDCLSLDLLPKIHGLYRDDLVKIEGIEQIADSFGCDEEYWTSNVRSYRKCMKEKDRTIDAVLVTHAHLDHSYYIPLVDENIPIYSSGITKKVLCCMEEVSWGGLSSEFTTMKSVGLSFPEDGTFPGEPRLERMKEVGRNWITVDSYKEVSIKDFRVTPYPVDHSIPGAVAFVVKDRDGRTIVYTGDFRFHGYNKLTHIFEEGISKGNGDKPDILIVEGTRINETQRNDEKKVYQQILKIVKNTSKLVMVGFGWKDITRYKTLKRVAEKSGRTLVISSKLACLLSHLKEFSQLHVKDVKEESNVSVYLRRRGSMLYSRYDYVYTPYDLVHFEDGVRAYHIQRNPSDFILHLDYYELNELIDIKPYNSVYIKASSEPLDEEMRYNEQRLINWLTKFGINTPENSPIYVHASGHASGPDIIDFIQKVDPKIIIPVHTEHSEEFMKNFDNVVIPEVGVPLDCGRLIK